MTFAQWIEMQFIMFVQGLIANMTWALPALGALAFVSWGPLGAALRRLAQSRVKEVTLLEDALKALATQSQALEQVHERLDYIERGLPQTVGRLPLREVAPEPESVTPH